ncbi:integrase catalytic domain-containing protein [Trichonephila clavata]|uniref:Integrase catalytic domain-containing protein n=1 Tax=Trichonephila clavata TaxID=2740835 RepID=A0A8X6M4W1_TRICU|nr:integrase catalytic domain-containing protein [Trichonephila clavata]
MGLEIPVVAKVIQLKILIESSNLYRNDIDFVRELMSNLQEEKRDEIELQKLKFSQFKKELELINAKKGLVDISQVSETKESSSLTDNLECLIRKTARRLQSELQDALQSCGMVLHKWSSNSPELLNSPSSSDVEHSFSAESDLSVKTLGISWKPLQDCFVFKVSIFSKSSFTKREVLSVIARLYDPLGLLGPVLTRAKILLQRLWQQKLDWDDVLPDQIAKEWKEFVTTFKCIETLQCFYQTDRTKVTILASKWRVAPIRVISIPRLELYACVLLAQLVQKIRSCIKLEISDIVLRTGSTIALAWLKTPANQLKTFIANRVSKIQRLTEKCNWFHVPSNLNPADLISRGLHPNDLPESELWWRGPPFLEQGKLFSVQPSSDLLNEFEYSSEFKAMKFKVSVYSVMCSQIVNSPFYLISCV